MRRSHLDNGDVSLTASNSDFSLHHRHEGLQPRMWGWYMHAIRGSTLRYDSNLDREMNSYAGDDNHGGCGLYSPVVRAASQEGQNHQTQSIRGIRVAWTAAYGDLILTTTRSYEWATPRSQRTNYYLYTPISTGTA